MLYFKNSERPTLSLIQFGIFKFEIIDNKNNCIFDLYRENDEYDSCYNIFLRISVNNIEIAVVGFNKNNFNDNFNCYVEIFKVLFNRKIEEIILNSFDNKPEIIDLKPIISNTIENANNKFLIFNNCYTRSFKEWLKTL